MAGARATTTLLPFLLLFGATYFISEFGPNTTMFAYPRRSSCAQISALVAANA